MPVTGTEVFGRELSKLHHKNTKFFTGLQEKIGKIVNRHKISRRFLTDWCITPPKISHSDTRTGWHSPWKNREKTRKLALTNSPVTG